jgi:putative FmdB family regulatory protein
MPLYEYECVDHGVFEAHRPMAESADKGACPVCRRGAPRIVSALYQGRMETSQVKAIERNEESRHEPRVVRAAPRPAGEPRPMMRASGGYPWAIGH